MRSAWRQWYISLCRNGNAAVASSQGSPKGVFFPHMAGKKPGRVFSATSYFRRIPAETNVSEETVSGFMGLLYSSLTEGRDLSDMPPLPDLVPGWQEALSRISDVAYYVRSTWPLPIEQAFAKIPMDHVALSGGAGKRTEKKIRRVISAASERLGNPNSPDYGAADNYLRDELGTLYLKHFPVSDDPADSAFMEMFAMARTVGAMGALVRAWQSPNVFMNTEAFEFSPIRPVFWEGLPDGSSSVTVECDRCGATGTKPPPATAPTAPEPPLAPNPDDPLSEFRNNPLNWAIYHSGDCLVGQVAQSSGDLWLAYDLVTVPAFFATWGRWAFLNEIVRDLFGRLPEKSQMDILKMESLHYPSWKKSQDGSHRDQQRKKKRREEIAEFYVEALKKERQKDRMGSHREDESVIESRAVLKTAEHFGIKKGSARKSLLRARTK